MCSLSLSATSSLGADFSPVCKIEIEKLPAHFIEWVGCFTLYTNIVTSASMDGRVRLQSLFDLFAVYVRVRMTCCHKYVGFRDEYKRNTNTDTPLAMAAASTVGKLYNRLFNHVNAPCALAVPTGTRFKQCLRWRNMLHCVDFADIVIGLCDTEISHK